MPPTLRGLWQRPDTRFLLLFLSILLAAFTTIAFQTVNDAVVIPYTSFVARMSGVVLSLLGEDITVAGCELRSPRFAVTIYNGCNGLITSLIFISGVLAFPASWRAKAIGIVGGLLSIQAINLVRIVSLFYIGVFLPAPQYGCCSVHLAVCLAGTCPILRCGCVTPRQQMMSKVWSGDIWHAWVLSPYWD